MSFLLDKYIPQHDDLLFKESLELFGHIVSEAKIDDTRNGYQWNEHPDSQTFCIYPKGVSEDNIEHCDKDEVLLLDFLLEYKYMECEKCKHNHIMLVIKHDELKRIIDTIKEFLIKDAKRVIG